MIVFDIDGTLSIVGDRLKCLENKDWDSFYDRCGEDKVNEQICLLYRTLMSAREKIIVVTGRREMCREATLDWFAAIGLWLDGENLYMRNDGDMRPDTVVKFEKIEHLIDDVTLVFEDRNCMVKEWRKRGVTVCQVAEGNF
jgi:hypothetical protein